MVGQTNLFDDVLKEDERFVIVVQSLEDKQGRLVKRTLREYPSLEHDQMVPLFEHLKDVYLNEPFEPGQSAYIITVYTNLDYSADNIYALVKRNHGMHEWTHTAK
ncbi:Uncharacterised protein [Staphylococcus piscifermentans]|uniref:Uncharacterized protein n=1 Tax=Staphylococcus piscifermentans TaxID=70258 RepID=A0A239U4R8_9STAP|nr:hypothetical protein [Staphylococcus piscifermentans]RTX86588.1 hypothetical protein CD139_00885 [Staphylococcus piscifermentans]GEP83557.1 hypothetical protein SPI02_01420 [Staphylococcus piscifermentans]SNV04946.1 Uncharacterised protein [Staphylococcus piscifermentans]